jgi:hypothetical protein
MTVLDISNYHELAAELRQGHPVTLVDHGIAVGQAQPVARPPRSQWLEDLAAFRASLGVPVMENAVLEMRAEDDR